MRAHCPWRHFPPFLWIFLVFSCGDGGGGDPKEVPRDLPATDAGITPQADTTPSGPACGNGTLESGEECDGADLGGQTCQALGFAAGQLVCRADCTFDPAGCQQGGNGRTFGQKCGGSWGNCAQGLTCVQFNEAGAKEGYCTQECSDTNPCPGSPAGAQCVFQLVSDNKMICGFLCSTTSPGCPPGLNCTLSQKGQYHYCSTDPPAQCGNGKIELLEECDGSDLNNMSCQAFGYDSGQLACNAGCKLDKSGCKGSSGCGNLPPRDCKKGDAYCGKLVPFSPPSGTGYKVTHGPKLSYIRQDTMMLVKHAAASVACMMPGSFPIGLGDMSMADGSTPKTSSGQLRHPKNTHDHGRDIDIAYYQTGQPNNHLRPVCPHTTGGTEQYHCTGKPDILDAPRSALLLAKLLESDRVRVIGVDGQIGPIVVAEAKKLHGKGMITSASLNAFATKLAYETTNTGKGWYQFHHHHFHMSTWTKSYGTPSTIPEEPPFGPRRVDPGQMPPMVLPVDRPTIRVLTGAHSPVLTLDPLRIDATRLPVRLGAYPALTK